MKQERNSAIMDDDLLEEAKALLSKLNHESLHPMAHVDLYNQFAYKLSVIGCTALESAAKLESITRGGATPTAFYQKQKLISNLQIAISTQDYLKERESLVLPLPPEQKAYLKKEAEKLSEFLKNLENFPEEKRKKLLDILQKFLTELEKDDVNISFLCACAVKLREGVRKIDLLRIIGAFTVATNFLPKLDDNLKAWDDIAPRLACYEQAVLSYLTPSGVSAEDEPKKLEEIKEDLKLIFLGEENLGEEN